MVNNPNLQPPEAPFVDPKTGVLSNDGNQFLIDLLNQLSQENPASVATGLKATGTNQATALQLEDDWNQITAGPANAGVLLQALESGQSQTVLNSGAIPYNVYPPPGAQIDVLGANAAFSLGAGVKKTFEFFSAEQISS